MRNIGVEFPGVKALDGVDLTLRAGEIHSLLGENGAGKSTLIKALTGVYAIDSGTINVAGATRTFHGTADAQAAGVAPVYQEINLLPNLSVGENVMLGHEVRGRFGINWRATHEKASTYLKELGLDIDPRSLLSTHSIAVQQLVAISRAVVVDCRLLVLDEPTSSLDRIEVEQLFAVMRRLRDRNVAIVFVSHFLDQVYEISDRVTVLRDGQLVGEYLTRELLRIDLVQAMLGRSVAALRSRPTLHVAEDDQRPYLSMRGGTVAARLEDADIDMMEGEVLGVAGLLGSGRTELARALTGLDKLDAGIINIRGRQQTLGGPRDAIALGVVYSSENRRTEGIISELSVRENITLALQADQGFLRRLRPARQRELALSWVDALDIRPADVDRPAGMLSGGNQQKVLLARLLALSPRALVLDEPTRGIDVGAKVHVQNLVGELADNGLSVMFISAELEEVLRVSNRVVIMLGRRIVDTIATEDLDVDSLTALVAQPDDFDE